MKEDEPDIDTETDSKAKRTKATSLFQTLVLSRLDYIQSPKNVKLMDTIKIENMGWTDDGKSQKKECEFEVRYFDIRHSYVIPMSLSLRTISHAILKQPSKLGLFKIDFRCKNRSNQVEPELVDNRLADFAPVYFLEARNKIFAAIINQPKINAESQSDGVIETTQLLKIEKEVVEYVVAYQEWLEALRKDAQQKVDVNILQTIEQVQRLDLIELVVPRSGGKLAKAYLLTPFHPLRLAWYLQLEKTYYNWEKQSLETPNPHKIWTDELKSVFLGAINPSNQPLIIHGKHLGEDFHYGGEISPGWGVYTQVVQNSRQEKTGMSRAIINMIQDLLNIPNQLRESADFSYKMLYRQIKRYLLHHPYVETLILNVFNPGDGQKIIDSIKMLQKEPNFADLRYEIRLISSANHIEETGRSFNDFLRPTGTYGGETDAFLIPSNNPLYPKLRYSRNDLESYQRQPESFSAHISVLLDFFPVEVKLVDRSRTDKKRSVFCEGLIFDPVNDLIPSTADLMGWDHFLAVNSSSLISSDNDILAYSSRALDDLQQLVSILLARQYTNHIPALSLTLKDDNRTLLYQIHNHSDWVVTIDKNLGVDLFDQPAQADSIPYLLDYKPGGFIGESPIYLTTRPTLEIRQLLVPFFQKYNLPIQDKAHQMISFLEAIRAISSSIIMQFLSNQSKAFEAIGMGLTKLLLEKVGLLKEHFIIPIDIHEELFDEAYKSSENILSRQRGDLILAAIDQETSILYFHLIEVKCRSHLLKGQALNDLKTQMANQLSESSNTLRYHFDPNMNIPDRPDRLIKNQQLYHLLSFYLERAFRYELVSEELYKEASDFIVNLGFNYNVTMKKTGIIFDFGSTSTDIIQEVDAGDLTYFYLGHPRIVELLSTLSKSEKTDLDEQELTPDYETVRTALTSHRNIGHRVTEKPIVDAKQDSEISGEQIDSQDRTKIEPEIVKEATSGMGEPVDEKPPCAENDYTMLQVYDFLGENAVSPQFGILGKARNNRLVGIDLNGCNTISLFGVPGSGKSYTLGTIVEMALKPMPNINQLPNPLASVIFHFNESQDYPPEFVSMRYANDHEHEIDLLLKNYGAKPEALEDILLLAPKEQVKERQKQYPDIEVTPISFASSELNIKDWKFLMGAIGNQTMYMQRINMIMSRGRDNLTFDYLQESIETSNLSEAQKDFARHRLELAGQYIDDNKKLGDLLRPGRLIIVDLRDPFIEKDQALGLFVVMLNIFAGVKNNNQQFNKLIVFDEAHKYITNSDLTSHVITEIREMRHKGVTLLIASQDPPSLPSTVIELSSLVILHRFNSPQWLKHIQKSVFALQELAPHQLTALQPGEAYVWANKALNPEWTKKAVKLETRPRVTLHGGSTQKAVL